MLRTVEGPLGTVKIRDRNGAIQASGAGGVYVDFPTYTCALCWALLATGTEADATAALTRARNEAEGRAGAV